MKILHQSGRACWQTERAAKHMHIRRVHKIGTRTWQVPKNIFGQMKHRTARRHHRTDKDLWARGHPSGRQEDRPNWGAS